MKSLLAFLLLLFAIVVVCEMAWKVLTFVWWFVSNFSVEAFVFAGACALIYLAARWKIE